MSDDLERDAAFRSFLLVGIGGRSDWVSKGAVCRGMGGYRWEGTVRALIG